MLKEVNFSRRNTDRAPEERQEVYMNGTFNLGIHSFNHPRDIYYALTMKDPKSVIIPTFKLGGQGDNQTTLKTTVLKSTDKVPEEFKENHK